MPNVLNIKTLQKVMLIMFIFAVASILRFKGIEVYPDYLSSDSAKFGFLLLNALEGEHNFPFAPSNFEFDETGLVYVSLPIALCLNPGVVVLRSISAIFGVFLVWGVFWFSRRLFNDQIAYISAFFIATLPWLTKLDHFIHQARFSIVCIAYLIAIGLIFPIRKLKFYGVLMSASAAGLSLYFHGSSRLLPVIIFILFACDKLSSKGDTLTWVRKCAMWFVVYAAFSIPMIYALGSNPSVTAHKLLRFSFWDKDLARQSGSTNISDRTEENSADSQRKKKLLLRKAKPPLSTNLESKKLGFCDHQKMKELDPDFNLRKRIFRSFAVVTKRLFFNITPNPKRFDLKGFIINPVLSIFLIIGVLSRTKYIGKKILFIWLMSWFLAMGFVSSGRWSTWYYILGIVPIVILSGIGIVSIIGFLGKHSKFSRIPGNLAAITMVVLCLIPNCVSYFDYIKEIEDGPVTLLNLHFDLVDQKLDNIPCILYFDEIVSFKHIPQGLMYVVESVLGKVFYLDPTTADSVKLVPGIRKYDYDPENDILFNIISRSQLFHSNLAELNIRIFEASRLKKSGLCISVCSGDLSQFIVKNPLLARSPLDAN